MLEKSPYFQDVEQTHVQEFINFDGTNLRNVPAVYSIENTKTKKFYIGSTVNVAARINKHKNELKNNEHHNKRLQQSFNKTQDKKSWEVHIALMPDKESAREREQLILDEGHGTSFMLNISDQVNRGGDPKKFDSNIKNLIDYNKTPESRLNKSKISKNLWQDTEYRKRMITTRGLSITVDGVNYDSIREASRETGVSIKTITDRLENNNCSLLGIKKERKVSALGIQYPSVTEAASANNVACNTMVWRCQNEDPKWSEYFYID